MNSVIHCRRLSAAGILSTAVVAEIVLREKNMQALRQLLGDASPEIHQCLVRVDTDLRDAAVTEISPRLRVSAAYDVAVFTAIILARMDGHAHSRNNGDGDLMAYFRDRSSARAGLERHINLLAKFNYDDYERIWTQVDAARALVAARRVVTALRWRLLHAAQSFKSV